MNCKNCGASIAPGAVACSNCGTILKKSSDFGKYDKTTMIIICIFLGALGIHNFMLGETKKGLLKIIVTVCSCCTLAIILPLIDLIKICTDDYTVDPDAFI